MFDHSFPESPAAADPQCEPSTRLVSLAPLAAIRQVLELSIHDVVNDRRNKHLVREFYRVTRWIDNEYWLRRQLER